MRRIYLLWILLVSFSCQNWLSVYPSGEMPVEEQFGSEQGVKDALAGAYVLVKDQSLYGAALSFTYIENMASLWDVTPSSMEESFGLHNYQEVSSVVDNIYGKLYNAIANVNNILEHMNPSVLQTPGMYEIIRGECLALRAFLHFDLMRLFGPIPQHEDLGGAKLPYVKVLSKETKLPIPWDEYKKLLETDLLEAEKLLKDHDPIISGENPEDEFFLNRTCRMNYYAVKALEARVYLWYGENEAAYNAAMEVINACDEEGNKIFDITSIKDAFSTSDYTIVPEQIFGLHDHQLSDKYMTYFSNGTLYKGNDSEEIVDNLYGSTGTDLRELNLWELQILINDERYTLKKYDKAAQYPLIRLSELYFIVIETAPAEQAQLLWDRFLSSRMLPTEKLPVDQEGKLLKILQEFRKEFYGEGQLFYMYKRYNSPREDILFADTRLVVNYIMPLPKTELK